MILKVSIVSPLILLYFAYFAESDPAFPVLSMMDSLEEFCNTIMNSSSNKYAVNQSYERNVVRLDAVEQNVALQQKRNECLCKIHRDPVRLNGLFCNRTWDNLMCWDDTQAGNTVYQPCPPYINNFRPRELASRSCLSNGSWFVHPYFTGTRSLGWTNFSACASSHETMQQLQYTFQVPYIFERNAQSMRLMYNVGYGLSLVSLAIAVVIMIYFKRLHCSRNTIHLNLFVSFILRAIISLVRDNTLVSGIGFQNDVLFNETGTVSFIEGTHWECRLFFSVFQYVLAASYIWIFVEAIYLHIYISISVFVKWLKVQWFILFGWTFPLAFVFPWCIAKYFFDNTLCWNTHYLIPGLVWIIQGPVMITMVLSFLCFISIIRVLCTKLRSPQCTASNTARYRRFARSTFFLVPTFGVYYIIFTVPYSNLSETMEFVMLFIEMFFNSFQGFFIALVLCFINAEVRVEIRKAWQRLECSCCNKIQSYKERLNSRTTYIQNLSYLRKAFKKDNNEEMELEVSQNGKLHKTDVCATETLSPFIQIIVTDR